jgi:hypothetical protein
MVASAWSRGLGALVRSDHGNARPLGDGIVGRVAASSRTNIGFDASERPARGAPHGEGTAKTGFVEGNRRRRADSS